MKGIFTVFLAVDKCTLLENQVVIKKKKKKKKGLQALYLFSQKESSYISEENKYLYTQKHGGVGPITLL